MASTPSNMDLTADFKSFQDLIQTSLINVTRSATQVSNQDLGFHRSSSEKLSRSLDRQNVHLLRLTNKLLKAATQDTHLNYPSLQNQDGIEDNWRGIVDVVDDLLEKADSALDEYSGVVKRQTPAPQDADASSKSAKPGKGLHRWAAESMPKPQRLFERQANNTNSSPFRPLLQTKPHATISLEESIGSGDSGYRHPYAREIEEYTYPASVHQVSPPIPFAPPDQSDPIFVDTEEGLKEMLEELKGATEIAIDLEHNEMRSYIGLVCLMQISTRDKDWIIDTLKPWREKLQMLNEVFADPKILKVLHGSNMDIIWLQRDLGLYIVGLFDTYHAACALQFPGKGLRHLLSKFADFEAQKQYQLADWRIRPLPVELVDYARSDTHYLLHIYDHMRNMLIEASAPNTNLTNYVLEQSKKEALQVYQRPVYDIETGSGPLGWFGLLTQRLTKLDNEQLGVFRAVHAWRDSKARELDEGIQYILSNKTLWLIAESMPTSAFNFHQACRGQSKQVQSYIPEIVEVVKKGKIEGRNGKSHQEVLQHAEEVLGMIPRRLARKEKSENRTTFSGLGATLQQLNANGEVTSLNYDRSQGVDKPIATRCSASHFWGDVIPQHQQLPPEAVTALDALTSILPLPIVGAKKEAEESNARPEAQPEDSKAGKKLHPWQSVPHTAASRLRSKASEIFTLNETPGSKKRKTDETESDETPILVKAPLNGSASTDIDAPNTGYQSLNPEFESKREAKKAKKAEKRARKEAEKAAADATAQETQAFDYANAASLLTPSAQTPLQRNGAQGQDTGTKRLNPFAKALDTSTGARRGKMGKELAGKSMTFSS